MACTELPLMRDESPALASAGHFCTPLRRIRRTASTPATSKPAINVSLVVVAFGHDVVAARKVRAQKPYDHGDIRSEILDTAEDGRLRVDYGQFHETVQD